MAPLHGEHGGAREQRLAVARIGRDQAVEVGERAREVVRALLERRAQQQRLCRRIRLLPPRREGGLRLAELAGQGGLACFVLAQNQIHGCDAARGDLLTNVGCGNRRQSEGFQNGADDRPRKLVGDALHRIGFAVEER